jgi:uncharacterized protein YutE (UPF0331/DUF86 family)
MSPFDIDTLERKLSNILKEIDFLADLSNSGISINSEVRDHYALLHSLQNALSATIDIVNAVWFSAFCLEL